MSCDQGGDSDSDLSPEEATETIAASFEDLGESLGALERGSFSTSLKGFLGLQNGEARSADWAGKLVEELETVIQIDDDRFDFAGSAGTYEWNADQQKWERRSGSDDIVLRFPATEGSQSNNATFTLSNYTDTEVTVDQEAVSLPTAVTASLEVDGTEVFSLDLRNVVYGRDRGFEVPVPQSFTLDVLTAPHAHRFALTSRSDTEYSFSYDLRTDNRLVAGVSVTALLASDTGAELDETDLEELSGEGRIGPDLTIPYRIQVAQLDALDDPSEEQINDLIDAIVTYRGDEIATLRYDEAADQIEVVFSDGSVEPASAFYEDFLDEMASVWSDYLGGDDIDFDLRTLPQRVVGLVRP
jgi:hypothetical protein